MPLVQFPIFYPVFLEIVCWVTQHDPTVFAPLLNELLFAALIFISGTLMNGFSSHSPWYKRILLSCIVLSPCLLEIYSMLWSETLFLILSLIFIGFLHYDYRTRNLRSLLLVSIVAALAFLTRYAGISLVGAGGLLLILDTRLSIIKRLIRASIFLIVSCSLVAINLARNLIVSGTLTGIRQKGTTPLISNLSYFGDTLFGWFSFGNENHTVALLTALVCIAVLGGLFFNRIRNQSSPLTYEHTAVTFAFVYTAFIILSATITRYQQLDSRLLSPLFIPLLWSLTFWIPKLAMERSGQARIWLISISLVLAAAFQYGQLKDDFETYDGVRDAGVPGYTEDPWPQSDIVTFIKNNPDLFLPGYALYSNAGDAVYFYTGRFCDLLPEKVFPIEVKEFYEEDEHYLIWFNAVDNPDMIRLKDILEKKKMVCIRQLGDGAVYRYDH